MSDSIYELEGQIYRPTAWAAGPWSRTTQHGAPINALFAREIEQVAVEIGMRVGRVTIDLFKAVPLEPLVAETRIVRQGRRVASVECSLHLIGDDATVSRATGALLKPSAGEGASWHTPEFPPPPPEQASVPSNAGGGVELPPGFHEKVDVRVGTDDAGPFAWMTTGLDLVAGEEITPLQRGTALTDMTLGSQMRMAFRRRAAGETGDRARTGSLMINTDTTVYWERPFVGDSLGLRPALINETDGIGTAEAVLYDRAGRVGRSLQSALAQRHFGTPGKS